MNIHTSLFLAQIIGISFSLMGISILLNPRSYQKMITAFSQNTDASILFRFFAGFFILILGVMMVLSHNLWTNDWRILVTIISWLTLLKGIFFLLFPELVSEIAKVYSSEIFLRIGGILVLVLGLISWYIGFFKYG